MSSMLEQAIIDATALKEAALKNAESEIIEKYSHEVKETLDKLLEQEEDPLGMGMDMGAEETAVADEDVAPEAPLAALEGDKACPCPDEDEEIELDLDLSALSDAADGLTSAEMGAPEPQADLLQQVAENTEYDITEEDIINLLSENDDSEESEVEVQVETEEINEDEEQESLSLEDELVEKIYEKLSVDLEPQKSGWAGSPADQIAGKHDDELARRRDDEVAEEVEALKKAADELMDENVSLKEQNEKFSSAILALKEKLDEVNLSNARLLYTNRVLNSASLNERQKKKIVEAISSASSAEEARVIFDTLQSTVGSSRPSRNPKSLSEAISRPSSVIAGSRREPKTESNPLLSRMQKLAGIK